MVWTPSARRGLWLGSLLLVAATEGTVAAPLAGTQRGDNWLAWVANSSSGTVSIIDLDTLTVVETIDVGKNPRGIVAEAVDVAIVASAGSSRIDVIDSRGEDPFLIPVGGAPEDLAIVGDRVVTTLPANNQLAIVSEDLSIDLIGVGQRPLGIAFSGAKYGLVAVANSRDNTVSLVPDLDLTAAPRFRAAQVIAVGKEPRAVSFDAVEADQGQLTGFNGDGGRLAVSSFKSRTVSIIDVQAGVIDETFRVGKGPWGVDIWSDGAEVVVLVANYRSNTATLIKDGSAVDISVGKRPVGAAFTEDGALAVVTNSRSNNVSIIDVATEAVIGTVAVGKKPHGVAIGLETGARTIPNSR